MLFIRRIFYVSTIHAMATTIPSLTSNEPPPPRYYRGAARFGNLFLPTLAVAGVTGAVLLGVVYGFFAFLANVCEFPYILIVGLGFFAAGLIPVSLLVCQIGKVRWRRLRLYVHFCVAVIGFYVAWVAYINFLSGSGQFSEEPVWLMQPIQIWHGLSDLADNRSAWCWVGWLMEPAMLFGLTFHLVKRVDTEIPFCEECDHWCEEIIQLELSDEPPSPINDILRGNFDCLSKIRPRTTHTHGCLRIRVHQCPCHASRFLSVAKVRVKPGKTAGYRRQGAAGGRYGRMIWQKATAATESATDIVTNLVIDETAVNQLNLILTAKQAEQDEAEERLVIGN